MVGVTTLPAGVARMRRLRRSELGLSLVEVAAAGTVVAVGLVGTAASLVPASKLTQNSVETREIARVSGALLEEVRATRFDLIDATFGDQRREIAGVEGAASPPVAVFTVSDEPTGSARWEVRRVMITITWRGLRGTETVKIGTLVSDRNATAAR